MNTLRAIKKLKTNELAIAADKMNTIYTIFKDSHLQKIIFTKNGDKLEKGIPEIVFNLKKWKIQTIY